MTGAIRDVCPLVFNAISELSTRASVFRKARRILHRLLVVFLFLERRNLENPAGSTDALGALFLIPSQHVSGLAKDTRYGYWRRGPSYHSTWAGEK